MQIREDFPRFYVAMQKENAELWWRFVAMGEKPKKKEEARREPKGVWLFLDKRLATVSKYEFSLC